MQHARALLSYKTAPTALRAGVTKGWALSHSVPERIFAAHQRNYLKMYFTIKEYLSTQNIKLLSFNMVPQDTTTVISMNIFWYKPVYRNVQTRRSKVFKPWTGWQSRWSRPPLTLWRPRLVQNLTHERKILQAETVEDIDAFTSLVKQQRLERNQLLEQMDQQQAQAQA